MTGLVASVKHVRTFPPDERGLPTAKPPRFTVTCNPLDPEALTFFVGTAAADTLAAGSLLAEFSRSHIERRLEDGRGEIGFRPFRRTTLRGLGRHLLGNAASDLLLVRVRDQKVEHHLHPPVVHVHRALAALVPCWWLGAEPRGGGSNAPPARESYAGSTSGGREPTSAPLRDGR